MSDFNFAQVTSIDAAAAKFDITAFLNAAGVNLNACKTYGEAAQANHLASQGHTPIR